MNVIKLVALKIMNQHFFSIFETLDNLIVQSDCVLFKLKFLAIVFVQGWFIEFKLVL